MEIDVYERIKDRRRELGISQQQLAEMTGYQSGSAINKIEKGKRDLSVSKIGEFAKALGVSPFWLMGMKPPEKTKFERLCDQLSETQKDAVVVYMQFILWRDSNGSI